MLRICKICGSKQIFFGIKRNVEIMDKPCNNCNSTEFIWKGGSGGSGSWQNEGKKTYKEKRLRIWKR